MKILIRKYTGKRVNFIIIIHTSNIRYDLFLVEQQQKGRNAKKGKKKRKSRPHARELAIAQGSQNLCGGFYKVSNNASIDLT